MVAQLTFAQRRAIRQKERYTPTGSLNTNPGDHDSSPVDFLALRNCLIDKRLSAVVKRGGSTTETIANGLAVPNGAGELISAAPTALLPIKRQVLANFAGTFYLQTGSSWANVSVDSNTSFSTSRQCQFSQLGTYVHIAAGRLAKYSGSGTIERVGIPAPTVAPTTAAVAGSLTATTGWTYMYTYYNPTTGLESDWSPQSASTGPQTSMNIQVTTPTTAALAAGVTQKRIYRTNDGGATYFLSGTCPIGTALYTDSVADASLTTQAKDLGYRGVPPTTYLIAKFAQCMFTVDATNPYIIRFSEPYTGADTDHEYYPTSNYVIANEPVTGYLATPGKLLVFHARSISYISGTSKSDFQFFPYKTGTGTLFGNSIATDGTDVVYLDERGWCSLSRQTSVISREIDVDLKSIMSATYNSSLYVSTCWSPAIRQFLICMSGVSTSGPPWEVVGTGSLADWETVGTGATDVWEDPVSPSTAVSTRVKFWGWSPELSDQRRNIWMEYTFPTATDLNNTQAYPTFIFHPQPSSDSLDPQQDKTYIGFFNGTQGSVVTAFRRDTSQDDGAGITSTILTGRICPGLVEGNYKYFEHILFPNSYADPTSDGLCTLSYLLDYDDPIIRGYTGSLIPITDTRDEKRLPQGNGRHIHISLVDTSTTSGKILLGEFFIDYRERLRRESR